MALDYSNLLKTMTGAAGTAFGDVWDDVKNFAYPELKKIAKTLVDIEKGLTAKPPYYTQDSAKVLLRMQLRATQAVLTAMTALTLLAIETAINAIMSALSDMVNTALGVPLLA